MQKISHICDVCGATKKETNHWWLLEENMGGVFKLRTWSEQLATVNGVQHLCSEQCAVAMVSRFMEAN